MEIVTAQELQQREVNGIHFDEPYGSLLGRPELPYSVFLWGSQGSGKSTLALGIVNAEVRVTGYPGLYVSAEEGTRGTIVSRSKRIGATADGLHYADYSTIEELQSQCIKLGVKFVVIDSTSVIDPSTKSAIDLHKWFMSNGISSIWIAHATKDEKYKGNSGIAHEADIVIRADQDAKNNDTHYAVPEKNRHATEGTGIAIRIPMRSGEIDLVEKVPRPKINATEHNSPTLGKSRRAVRSNAKKTMTARESWLEDRILNGTSIPEKDQFYRLESTEAAFDGKTGMVYPLGVQSAVVWSQGVHVDDLWYEFLDSASDEDRALVESFLKSHKGDQRSNPVHAFKIRLADVVQKRKSALRGLGWLNPMVDPHRGVFVDWKEGSGDLTFRRRRRLNENREQVQIMEMLVDGKIVDAEGDLNASAALRRLVLRNKHREIQVDNQEQAKRILGARAYRKREKEEAAGKSTARAVSKTTPKPSSAKPTTKRKKKATTKPVQKRRKGKKKARKSATPRKDPLVRLSNAYGTYARLSDEVVERMRGLPKSHPLQQKYEKVVRDHRRLPQNSRPSEAVVLDKFIRGNLAEIDKALGLSKNPPPDCIDREKAAPPPEPEKKIKTKSAPRKSTRAARKKAPKRAPATKVEPNDDNIMALFGKLDSLIS